MLRLLFDADAFLAARSLGLLRDLCALAAAGKVELVLTRWVVKNELTDLASELAELETAKQVRIHPLLPSDPAGRQWRAWMKERPRAGGRAVDKGELECIAWAIEASGDGPFFVSCDGPARSFAKAQRVPSPDILDLVCELVERELLPLDAARQRLQVWDENFIGRGRPKGYEGLEQALKRRRQPH